MSRLRAVLVGAFAFRLGSRGAGDIPKGANVLYAHLGGQPALNAYSGVLR
ncbi:hypothetical protein [Microbispora sp. NBC_01389]